MKFTYENILTGKNKGKINLFFGEKSKPIAIIENVKTAEDIKSKLDLKIYSNFTYANIISEEPESSEFINIFFKYECIALIKNKHLAKTIKDQINMFNPEF